MTVIKAAAVQISPVLYSREATVDKIVRKIHELGRKGVQFATFPETVVPKDFDVIDVPFPERGSPRLVKGGVVHRRETEQPEPAPEAVS